MRIIVFVSCLTLTACAEGGSNGRDVGGSDVSSDASVDAPGVDADTNVCVDDSAPPTCEAATVIPVSVGGLEVINGVLPMLSVPDWHVFQIDPGFREEMMGAGQGTLTIELEADDPTMRMEVRNSCAESIPVACADDGSTGIDVTSFSFVDNQSEPGEVGGDGTDNFTTRNVPWPEEVAVRIYHIGGPVACNAYSLRVSRTE